MKRAHSVDLRRWALLGGWVAVCASLWATARPPEDPLRFRLEPMGFYGAGGPYAAAAAKVVAYDAVNAHLLVANERDCRLEVLDIHDPTLPTLWAVVDLTSFGAVVNSVASVNGLVAVAMQPAVKTDAGQVVLLDCNLELIQVVPVGPLPDMLRFSPDGRWLVVGNEGEPSGYGLPDSLDPEGSVDLIDLSTGVVTPTVTRVEFTEFNDVELDPSIRIFGPGASVAQDLEPEGIAVSPDSRTAYVTLQENNAMAVIDLAAGRVVRLVGLGYKDHRIPGNGLDASDRDNANQIALWPVRGLYLPDEVAAFHFQGATYLVMANEGDARDYVGLKEEARVGTLSLDPDVFPNAAELKLAANLGRLNVTQVGADRDEDGDVDVLQSFGARSFTIRDAWGQVVFDSGDDFEQLTALLYPDWFNCSNSNITRDGRSTSKGPEPEGVVLGKVAGRLLAFIGLERIGGVMVYDVSDPFAVEFVDYVNTRTFAKPFAYETAGDLGPEGLLFIGADESPTGKPLLAVAHEISGSVGLFEIVKEPRRGPGAQ